MLVSPATSSSSVSLASFATVSIPATLTKRLSSSSVLSSNSIPFSADDGDVEVVTEEGVRHAKIRLEARKYKTDVFAEQLLRCLLTLNIPSWSNPPGEKLSPENVRIAKVSGSLTNAVFFVSYRSTNLLAHGAISSSTATPRTVLLRIYGPSSGALISRPRELHTLHVLSSRYHIGPRVYGTFENGRVEEYFESTTLTREDMRDPVVSGLIGARMAELHGVDVEDVEDMPSCSEETEDDKRWAGVGVKKNVESWLTLAREVIELPAFLEEDRITLDLDTFEREWGVYLQWLTVIDDPVHGSQRVFSHNDAQYGNLLRLKKLKKDMAEHHRIIVVDFEYASPNPSSFDIANHFIEWTANYYSPTPHILQQSQYPTREQRNNFYTAYLDHSPFTASTAQSSPTEKDLDALDEQVSAWTPASHAMWAVWGIVQARDDIENAVPRDEREFDYVGYALGRMEGFRRELRERGIAAKDD